MTGGGRKGLPQFMREAVGPDAERLDDVARALDHALGGDAGALPPRTPSASARGRLLASATGGPLRYAPFFDRLTRLFDLSRDAVVSVLERAGSESEWEPGPHPSLRVLHLQGGPAVAAADTGLVRMPADFVWPEHRHGGAESVLILEGQYTEAGGRVYRAGDLHEMGPGSVHGFTVPPGSPLLLAVVLFGGLELL